MRPVCDVCVTFTAALSKHESACKRSRTTLHRASLPRAGVGRHIHEPRPLLSSQLGIPIVVSAAAAAPLQLAEAPSASGALNQSSGPRPSAAPAFIADSAEAFIAQVQRLYGQPPLWKRAVAAARARFREMMADDPATHDMLALLAATCSAARAPGWPELRFTTAGVGTSSRPPTCASLTSLSASRGLAEHATAPTTSSEGHPSALLILAAGEPLPTRAAALLHRVWWRLCYSCRLRCFEHPERAGLNQTALSFRSVTADTDIWMDGLWAAPAKAIQTLPTHVRVLRFWRGNAAQESDVAESPIKQLQLPLPWAGCEGLGSLPPMVRGAIKALGGEHTVWRLALQFAGVEPSAIPHLFEMISEETARATADCMLAARAASMR